MIKCGDLTTRYNSTRSSCPCSAATATLHLAVALPQRLAMRLASQTVQWAAETEHRSVEPPTRQWTLAGELLLNLGRAVQVDPIKPELKVRLVSALETLI